MSRVLLTAVASTLVFGATAAARSGGQAVRPRTLGVVSGSVVGLAQEGSWFTWIRNRGVPLEVGTFPGRRFSLPASTTQRGCWRCSLLDRVAVGAGGRVLWQEVTDGGNTYLVVSVKTAAPGARRARTLAETYLGDEEGNPDWIDPERRGRGLPMAANGNALLFYAACEGGELCYPRRIRAGIYRAGARRPKLLAKARDPVALAVAGRRFAVVTNSARCCSFEPVWSHDGKRIAWVYRRDLWSVRSDGTDDRRVAAGLLPAYWQYGVADPPSWSPDDARLAFDRMERDKAHPERVRSVGIFRVDADGRGLRRLAAGTAPAWSPDGTRIAFVRGSHIFSITPDGTGERRLTTAARATAPPLSWAPDATRIAVSRGGDIYSIRADGGGEARLTTSRRRETQPTWSPDGGRIAYVDGSAITVVNGDGTGAKRLTKEDDASPAWSPDSKRIAFVRGEGAWIMNGDGSGRHRLLRHLFKPSLRWSPGPSIVAGDRYPDPYSFGPRPGVVLISSLGKETKIAPVPHSPVELRDARSGRFGKRFAINGYAVAAALATDYVALLVDHEPGLRVELYGLNGRLRFAAGVPPSAHDLSAAGRNVIFVTGHVIRRLDARTGAVKTLVTTRRVPVGVSIKERRVVWAEHGRGGTRIRAVTAP